MTSLSLFCLAIPCLSKSTVLEKTWVRLSVFDIIVLTDFPPARLPKPRPTPNLTIPLEFTQKEIHPSLPLNEPSHGGLGDSEEFPRIEDTLQDTLEEYCQQALLSDGLQRIDEWTYVVQDWNEPLGILEVSLFVCPSAPTK